MRITADVDTCVKSVKRAHRRLWSVTVYVSGAQAGPMNPRSTILQEGLLWISVLKTSVHAETRAGRLARKPIKDTAVRLGVAVQKKVWILKYSPPTEPLKFLAWPNVFLWKPPTCPIWMILIACQKFNTGNNSGVGGCILPSVTQWQYTVIHETAMHVYQVCSEHTCTWHVLAFTRISAACLVRGSKYNITSMVRSWFKIWWILAFLSYHGKVSNLSALLKVDRITIAYLHNGIERDMSLLGLPLLRCRTQHRLLGVTCMVGSNPAWSVDHSRLLRNLIANISSIRLLPPPSKSCITYTWAMSWILDCSFIRGECVLTILQVSPRQNLPSPLRTSS